MINYGNPRGSIGEWLSELAGIAARLYESNPDAWQHFEPARKQLVESVVWLDAEGELMLSVTIVTEARDIIERRLPRQWTRWKSALERADITFG